MFDLGGISLAIINMMEAQASMEEDRYIMSLPPGEQGTAWAAKRARQEREAKEREERRKELAVEERHGEVMRKLDALKWQMIFKR